MEKNKVINKMQEMGLNVKGDDRMNTTTRRTIRTDKAIVLVEGMNRSYNTDNKCVREIMRVNKDEEIIFIQMIKHPFGKIECLIMGRHEHIMLNESTRVLCRALRTYGLPYNIIKQFEMLSPAIVEVGNKICFR